MQINNCIVHATNNPHYSSPVVVQYSPAATLPFSTSPANPYCGSCSLVFNVSVDVGGIAVSSSNNLPAIGNTLGGTLSFSASSGVVYTNHAIGNSITLPSPHSVNVPSLIAFIGSSTGSVITANVLDGGWDGTGGASQATDDAIVTEGLFVNGIISNNTMRNVYDCGYENAGLVQGTKIFGNQISGHVGNCAFGGWYWSSLLNNEFYSNVFSPLVGQTGGGQYYAAFFSYQTGTQAGWMPPDWDPSSPLYFQGNSFHDNIYSKPANPNPYSYDVYINIAGPLSVPFYGGGNTFTNNNFSYLTSGFDFIEVYGIGPVTDGGGNVCNVLFMPYGAPQPFVCHAPHW